jgi:hypothetical protein
MADIHDSGGENGKRGKLLLRRHLQLPDEGDRQKNDGNVAHHVQKSGPGVPQLGLELAVPKSRAHTASHHIIRDAIAHLRGGRAPV